MGWVLKDERTSDPRTVGQRRKYKDRAETVRMQQRIRTLRWRFFLWPDWTVLKTRSCLRTVSMKNIQKMSPERRAELGVQELPRSIKEAVEELEKRRTGTGSARKDLAHKIIKAQKKEYKAYCMQVTDWEIENYLYKM